MDSGGLTSFIRIQLYRDKPRQLPIERKLNHRMSVERWIHQRRKTLDSVSCNTRDPDPIDVGLDGIGRTPGSIWIGPHDEGQGIGGPVTRSCSPSHQLTIKIYAHLAPIIDSGDMVPAIRLYSSTLRLGDLVCPCNVNHKTRDSIIEEDAVLGLVGLAQKRLPALQIGNLNPPLQGEGTLRKWDLLCRDDDAITGSLERQMAAIPRPRRQTRKIERNHDSPDRDLDRFCILIIEVACDIDHGKSTRSLEDRTIKTDLHHQITSYPGSEHDFPRRKLDFSTRIGKKYPKSR